MNTNVLLILLLVLLLLLLCVFGWLWWRRRASRPPREAHAPAPAPQLDRRAFARALRALHPRDADYRYDKPCVLVCGGAHAGKSDLLRGAGLDPLVLQDGFDSGWWRSPEGVAFELPSLAWENNGGPWLDFLRLIERHRSLRALDAIVWTIPWSANAHVGVEGERMYRKLTELQDRLGLSLPIYVVVTGCEGADGFAQWAERLPSSSHAQTLGWSNPHPPHGPWRRDLAAQGVATLAQRLRRLVSALAARRDLGEHGPSVLLMPERIAAGLAPLQAALQTALRPNAVLTPFTLRGIYLSGRAAAPPAEAAAAPGIDPFAPPPPALVPGIPLFCRDLFARRVFGEFGLAQPVARRVASERRGRRLVLAGGALLAAVWTIALIPAWFSLERQLQAMRTPLLGMHGAIVEARRDMRINERGTIELLTEIDRVPDWDTRRVALPWSWFSCCGGLDADIDDAFRSYYEHVLFDSLDEALDERAIRLTASAPAVSTGASLFGAPERMAEFVAMREFVDATLEYEHQHARFDSLTEVRGGTWPDATNLFSYLFGLQLHPGKPRSVALFDQAVRDSRLVSGRRNGDQNATRFQAHLKRLHHAWLERLFGATELTALQHQLVEGVRALAAHPSAEGPELARLQADIGRLRTLLGRTDVAWMADGHLAGSEPYRQLEARVRKSRLLGAGLADGLAADVAARQGAFRSSVDTDSSGPTPVLAYTEGKQLLVNEDLAGLEEAIGRLLQHPFAQGAAFDAVLPDPAQPWQWDDVRLAAAGGALAELQGWEDTDLVKAPAPYQAALRQLARSQAAGVIERELVAAVAPAACEPRWRCANFDDARTHVAPLLQALHKVELVALADRWSTLLDRQALALLRGAEAAAESADLFLPAASAVAGWDGTRGTALSGYGLDGVTELPDYLASQVGVLAELAAASKGARAWLAQQPSGVTPDARQALKVWGGIDAELVKHAAKAPGGSLPKLAQWFEKELAELDAVNCAARLARNGGAGGGDYFGRRMARIATAYRPRCLALQGGAARTGYDALAAHFDQHLLGRYPFAAVGAPPADPEQVRQLLALLDRHLAATRAPLARQKDAQSVAALAFLDRLDGARPLLGAMLTEDPTGGPAALDLWPQFRLNRAREKGADQIIEWSVEAGDTLPPQPGAPVAGVPGVSWRLGQPIALRLRWAKNSEVTPAADPARPGMRVTGRSVGWQYDDPWALLRVLREHAAPLSELAERDARTPGMLRFAVPTHDAAGKPATAIAYARLAVSKHGKPEPLALPSFPTGAAPPLPAGFVEKGSMP